ncbi:hypothetical protein ARMGADRAFT_113830 [Armillaria gallica]|uniref:Uncharacterized protein n=1 Tax=Armillaria gallica TaxID=47427 RepID=A0A2H3E0D6_ARMGA|nr:hypothetical protein ARMGADRAFT_113830 [Armillaria gallica]
MFILGQIKALVDAGPTDKFPVPIPQATREPAASVVLCRLVNGCFISVERNRRVPGMPKTNHLDVPFHCQADAARHPQLHTTGTTVPDPEPESDPNAYYCKYCTLRVGATIRQRACPAADGKERNNFMPLDYSDVPSWDSISHHDSFSLSAESISSSHHRAKGI